jgi:hypothetical protein
MSYLIDDKTWILGAGPGSDALYEACTGVKTPAPERTLVITDAGTIVFPKCAVDDQNAPTTLRDPHNWVLNLLLYHGLIGSIIFIFPFLVLSRHNYSERQSLDFTRLSIMGFFICGLFGVIISAPFAMLPITVLMAGALTRYRGRHNVAGF